MEKSVAIAGGKVHCENTIEESACAAVIRAASTGSARTVTRSGQYLSFVIYFCGRISAEEYPPLANVNKSGGVKSLHYVDSAHFHAGQHLTQLVHRYGSQQLVRNDHRAKSRRPTCGFLEGQVM